MTASVATAPALELRNLRKQFGRTSIINGVDLTIKAGERHALIGPNGAGKSTLFNLISGRFAPTSGDVLLHGKSIAGRPAYEICRLGLSRSFQITNVFPKLSVFENLRCSLLWSSGHRYSFWERLSSLTRLRERTEAILEETQLTARRDTPAGLLTYAEQRALEIGMTIAGGASVILLDEPTAGMSHYETEYVVELIRRMTEGRTLLMVEHDMSVVFGLADRISVLVYGQVIATDTPEAIRANPAVQEAYLGTSAEAA
ncbi:ABC transporter ATP-binding protein [uncultured Ferrovibrio sp.]|jgi:branched-chain amino acid transport system ATP-binding protein|uniref:ABC transporter ATP-binding protein n=1 Tax=uncultured Ferrovibrio sp. TaxID=1576913 RepID=UPI00262714F1|nr:ABC transporter ATP-binding protein [uncultured Ferrovibrio sp.]